MPIHLRDIVMQFPGTRALDGVSLTLREGEVHSIVGENGAGKSTLLGVLSGSLRPTAGTVQVGDEPVQFRKPADALVHGIALVSQEGSLVPHLSAAENLLLGHEPHTGGVLRGAALLAQAEALVQRWFGTATIDLGAEVQTLPFADQKLIEILRALNSAARILILDEPTAALPAREKAQLWDLIRSLARQGVGIVYVSHLLSEVLALSDTISVLRDGRLVGQTNPAQCDETRLIELMLGRRGERHQRERASDDLARSPVVLEVEGWRGDGFEMPRFALRSGEVVGLVGLTHAGHHPFARSLYEVPLQREGTLRIDGRTPVLRCTQDSSRAGIALVPDHRMVNSLVAGWSVQENLALAHARRLVWKATGVLARRREGEEALACMARLRVKAYSPHQPVEELSGGNKQKVSVGKWLFADGGQPGYRVLIFIEPTEGVDVGAKAEIHRLVRDLAAAGLGIVVVSSDLLEVQALADRVIAFREGRPTDEIPAAHCTEARLIDAMAGGRPA